MLRLVAFAVGCAILLVAFGIGWGDCLELYHRTVVMQVLMGALGVVFILLTTVGILTRDKERWTALTMGSILLIGFSALVFFSIGWMIAPLALFFLGFSLWKVVHFRPIARNGL